MKAIYGYDPAKWRLGTLCKHGHAWPGTQQSLRRIPSAKHPSVAACAGCTITTAFWLARFITGVEGGELPPGTKLVKPCKRGHTYLDTGWCLQKAGKCVECVKGRRQREALNPELVERRRARSRAWEQRNSERINARRRERLQECPELYQRRLDGGRRRRERLIAQGLSTRYGTPRKVTWSTLVQRAIRSAGRCPTVAQLVATEQRRYWREHPDEHRVYRAQRTRELWRWKYMMSPSLRRYHHEKSRRRKALERGNHVVRVTSAQIRERFKQFDHCCAYCGTAPSELQTEHFLPISKGGTHVLSNILPACQTCNYSKRALDPETWYRSQPFFTEQRWRMILNVLGRHRGPVQQLSLV